MDKLKESADHNKTILLDLNSNDEVNSIIWLYKMEREKVEEYSYFVLEIYAWYAGTTGLALKRRTEMVMSPPCPNREEDIANVLEQWAKQVDMLSGFGAAHRLPST